MFYGQIKFGHVSAAQNQKPINYSANATAQDYQKLNQHRSSKRREPAADIGCMQSMLAAPLLSGLVAAGVQVASTREEVGAWTQERERHEKQNTNGPLHVITHTSLKCYGGVSLH